MVRASDCCSGGRKVELRSTVKVLFAIPVVRSLWESARPTLPVSACCGRTNRGRGHSVIFSTGTQQSSNEYLLHENKQTDRQTNKQAGTHSHTTDRQTDRQTDREKGGALSPFY